MCCLGAFLLSWILDIIASLIFFHGNSKKQLLAGTAPRKTNLGVFLGRTAYFIISYPTHQLRTLQNCCNKKCEHVWCLGGGGVPLGDTHTHTNPSDFFYSWTLWHHTEVVLPLLHFDWLYIQSHGHSAKALQQTVIQYIRCCTHSNQMQTQIPLTFSTHDTLTSYRGRTVINTLTLWLTLYTIAWKQCQSSITNGDFNIFDVARIAIKC